MDRSCACLHKLPKEACKRCPLTVIPVFAITQKCQEQVPKVLIARAMIRNRPRQYRSRTQRCFFNEQATRFIEISDCDSRLHWSCTHESNRVGQSHFTIRWLPSFMLAGNHCSALSFVF